MNDNVGIKGVTKAVQSAIDDFYQDGYMAGELNLCNKQLSQKNFEYVIAWLESTYNNGNVHAIIDINFSNNKKIKKLEADLLRDVEMEGDLFFDRCGIDTLEEDAFKGMNIGGNLILAKNPMRYISQWAFDGLNVGGNLDMSHIGGTDSHYHSSILLKQYTFTGAKIGGDLDLSNSKLARFAKRAFNGLNVGGSIILSNTKISIIESETFYGADIGGDIKLGDGIENLVGAFDGATIGGTVYLGGVALSIQSREYLQEMVDAGKIQVNIDGIRMHSTTKNHQSHFMSTNSDLPNARPATDVPLTLQSLKKKQDRVVQYQGERDRCQEACNIIDKVIARKKESKSGGRPFTETDYLSIVKQKFSCNDRGETVSWWEGQKQTFDIYVSLAQDNLQKAAMDVKVGQLIFGTRAVTTMTQTHTHTSNKSQPTESPAAQVVSQTKVRKIKGRKRTDQEVLQRRLKKLADCKQNYDVAHKHLTGINSAIERRKGGILNSSTIPNSIYGGTSNDELDDMSIDALQGISEKASQSCEHTNRELQEAQRKVNEQKRKVNEQQHAGMQATMESANIILNETQSQTSKKTSKKTRKKTRKNPNNTPLEVLQMHLKTLEKCETQCANTTQNIYNIEQVIAAKKAGRRLPIYTGLQKYYNQNPDWEVILLKYKESKKAQLNLLFDARKAVNAQSDKTKTVSNDSTKGNESQTEVQEYHDRLSRCKIEVQQYQSAVNEHERLITQHKDEIKNYTANIQSYDTNIKDSTQEIQDETQKANDYAIRYDALSKTIGALNLVNKNTNNGQIKELEDKQDDLISEEMKARTGVENAEKALENAENALEDEKALLFEENMFLEGTQEALNASKKDLAKAQKALENAEKDTPLNPVLTGPLDKRKDSSSRLTIRGNNGTSAFSNTPIPPIPTLATLAKGQNRLERLDTQNLSRNSNKADQQAESTTTRSRTKNKQTTPKADTTLKKDVPPVNWEDVKSVVNSSKLECESVTKEGNKTTLKLYCGIFYDDRAQLANSLLTDLAMYNNTSHNIAVRVECDDQKLPLQKGKLRVIIDQSLLTNEQEVVISQSIRDRARNFKQKEETYSCFGR